MTVDFLILGQGIAGSVLALKLLENGQSVVVINNTSTNQASKVAAGLYNPITGNKMSKTWLAEAIFPYLTNFYYTAEQTLATQFLHEKHIFRPFLTAEERAVWLNRGSAAAYKPFIESVVDASYQHKNMVYRYGGLLLKQAGYVDVPCFLKATRVYLKRRGAYLEADFKYPQIQLGTGITYQGIEAQKLIFCEGPQVVQNPFFGKLSFRPVKGERIEVILQQPLEVIYNRGVFVLPQAGSQALVGATYERCDLSLKPTARARQFLEQKLHSTFSLTYTVIGQKAGICPATFDSKAFIGLHPYYQQLAIFNGFGSKGVSLAPYLAKVFVKHLLFHKGLPKEVECSRAGLWPN